MIISIFLPMTVAGKEAKVTFDYESQDQDELTLKLGDIVHVLGEEEPGWWRGQVGGKTGVFPSEKYRFIYLNQETRFNTQYLSETISNNQKNSARLKKHVILLYPCVP